MPYEYLETARHKLPLEAEKHLMQATLEDAFNPIVCIMPLEQGASPRSFSMHNARVWARNDEWPFHSKTYAPSLPRP